MTQPVGGLRARFIKESFAYMLRTALDDLGWFDPGDYSPITLVTTPFSFDEEIPLNTIVLVDGDEHEVDWEVGSNLAEHRADFFIDFYAEKDALGIHVIKDIKAIVEGRMSAIGRTRPNLPVYDWTMATPDVIFYVEFEDVADHRSNSPTSKSFEKYWRTVSGVMLDYWADENY